MRKFDFNKLETRMNAIDEPHHSLHPLSPMDTLP